MRIVKLSEEIFPELEEVIEFFRDYLPARNPPGKFRITEGRIAQDGLEPGEEIMFSYNGRFIRDKLRKGKICQIEKIE